MATEKWATRGCTTWRSPDGVTHYGSTREINALKKKWENKKGKK